jgi:hypothetical protein
LNIAAATGIRQATRYSRKKNLKVRKCFSWIQKFLLRHDIESVIAPLRFGPAGEAVRPASRGRPKNTQAKETIPSIPIELS